MDIEPSKVEADSDDELLIILQQIMNTCVSFFTMVNLFMLHRTRLGTHRNIGRLRAGYSLISRIPERVKLLRGIIGLTDETAIIHLRMDRFAFTRLLMMLENSGGLKGTRNSTTAEQLAQFLNILAHHTKNGMVKDSYKRSTCTVSKHFHNVLKSLIKIHPLLLVQPEPIDGNCTDTRWSCFKGCLGALDGTYVNVIVPKCDMGWYRNRKGNVAVNILAACDKELNFTYVLSGWEGSAADSRVLSDAVTRNNGLLVPKGNYYLCDNVYTNGEGFLTPYRGVRYHVDEWASGNARPRNKEEFFNMKHYRAWNVIERAFGLLKKRWAILRSPAFYPIRIQNHMIMACCLLHNFIRRTMHYDPMETEILPYYVNDTVDDSHIDVVESSPQWTAWRDNMASEMYNEWRG